MSENLERKAIRPSRIPQEAVRDFVYDPEKGDDQFPVVNGENLGALDVKDLIAGLNTTLDPQTMRESVSMLHEAHSAEDMRTALNAVNDVLCKKLDITFTTKLKIALAGVAREHGIERVPFTKDAVQKDMEHGALVASLRMRYLTDAVFANFNKEAWETEFLEKRGAATGERPYTLVEYFGEKFEHELKEGEAKNFIGVLHGAREEDIIEEFVFTLALNFSHGLKHIRSIQKDAASPEDLHKKVRQLMHVNASTFLTNMMMSSAEHYSYFWKPVREMLKEQKMKGDVFLGMACDTPFKSAQSPAPTRVCPAHYLPGKTINDIIDLMAQYPEGPVLRRGLF